jgi:protocatechuate 3,4-dioxygenase beta subunit
MYKKISRRTLTRRLGIAAGLGLAAPALSMSRIVTPAQVKGPFHPIDESAETDSDLTLLDGHSKAALGETILVRGRVFNTRGEPLRDALVDVWQANHLGRYSHPKDPNTAALDPNFQGWGLMNTDAEGNYGFKTIKPGAYPLSFLGEEGWRCRHIHFKVSHPDYDEVITQMYFEGDPLIAQDLEIAKAPADQRQLLIVRQDEDKATGLPLFNFDLTLGT